MTSRAAPLVATLLILAVALPAAAAPREEEPRGATAPAAPDGGVQDDGENAAEVDGDDPFRRPGHQWTIFLATGIAQTINRSADIDVVTAGLRWSHLWSRKGDGAFAGQPAFAVEILPLMTFDQQPRAYGAGFNLVYEHHFAAGGSVVPIWRFGAGAVASNEQVPPGERELNFSLLTGLGLDVPFDERFALSLEYRFHHVSNADTGFRNPGINAHTLVVGITLP